MRSKCCLVLAHLKAVYIILIHVAVQPVENRDIEGEAATLLHRPRAEVIALRRYEPTTRLAVEGASTKKASRLDSTMRLDSTIGILVSIRLKEDSSAGLVFLYRRLNLQ